MRKKYEINLINDQGEILKPEQSEGTGWKMKAIPEGRDYSVDFRSDNIYKAQQEALSEWVMKMKW